MTTDPWLAILGRATDEATGAVWPVALTLADGLWWLVADPGPFLAAAPRPAGEARDRTSPAPLPPPASRWRHLKTNGGYVVVGVAVLAHAGRPWRDHYVVYAGDDGRWWARPVQAWAETVTLPDGRSGPRFQRID